MSGPADATPRVGVLGLGALGGALAALCASRGVAVQAWTRSHERREWWRRTRGLAVHEDPATLAEWAELLLLCVDDAAVPELVERLEPLAPRAVAHTAGGLPVAVLAPLAERGWHTGSAHPLAPVPAHRPEALVGAAWTLAGDPEAVARLRALAEAVGAPTLELSDDRRRDRYHAACALLSNGLVGLAAVAERLLAELAADPEHARAAVRSLLTRTVANLDADSPARTLTGPVRRGDVLRVERHLEALDAEDRELYRRVSAALLPLVAESLEPARREALERLLRQGPEGDERA